MKAITLTLDANRGLLKSPASFGLRRQTFNFIMHELIPKATKMKIIPTFSQQEGNEALRNCRANEAWCGGEF